MAKEESFASTLKKTLKIGLKKCFKLIPLFVPLFLLLVTGIFIFFNIYTSKIIGTFSLGNLIPWAVAFLVLVIAKIGYKIFFTISLERY